MAEDTDTDTTAEATGEDDASKYSESGTGGFSPTDDQPAPADPGAPTDPETLKLMQGMREAYGKALEDQGTRFQTYGNEQLNKIAGDMQTLKEMQQATQQAQASQPAELVEAPIPKWLNDEKERLKLGPIAMDMIKWGAVPSGVVSLGFGSNRAVDKMAGAVHMTFWAKALAALGAGPISPERLAEVRKFAEIWHKNQEYWQERNKAKIEQYKEFLENKKLSYSQQLDLIGKEASFLGDYRNIQAAKRGSIKDIFNNVLSQAKLSIEFEKHLEANRKEWWKHLGLNAFLYQEWVKKKGGPDFDEEHTSQEQLEQIRKRYPYSDFIREKTEEELKKQVETARQRTMAEEGEKRKAAEKPLSKEQIEAIKQRKAAEAKGSALGRHEAEEEIDKPPGDSTGTVKLPPGKRKEILKDLGMGDTEDSGSETEDSGGD